MTRMLGRGGAVLKRYTCPCCDETASNKVTRQREKREWKKDQEVNGDHRRQGGRPSARAAPHR